MKNFLLFIYEQFINSTYSTFIRNIRVFGYCGKIWKSIGITSEFLPWKVYSGISFSRSDVGQGRVCASFLTKPFLQICFLFLLGCFYHLFYEYKWCWFLLDLLCLLGSLFWGDIYPCRVIRFANCFLLLVLDPFFTLLYHFSSEKLQKVKRFCSMFYKQQPKIDIVEILKLNMLCPTFYEP